MTIKLNKLHAIYLTPVHKGDQENQEAVELFGMMIVLLESISFEFVYAIYYF